MAMDGGDVWRDGEDLAQARVGEVEIIDVPGPAVPGPKSSGGHRGVLALGVVLVVLAVGAIVGISFGSASEESATSTNEEPASDPVGVTGAGSADSDPSDARTGESLPIVQSWLESDESGVANTGDDSETADVRPPEFDLAVAATLELESFRFLFNQETGPVIGSSDTLVVGQDSSTSGVILGHHSNSVVVDRRAYELEGDQWYLKPLPLAQDQKSVDLSLMLGGLDEVDVVEVERTARRLEVVVVCSEADNVPANLRAMCSGLSETTIVIDLQTMLIESLWSEGKMETYPGQYHEGFAETRIELLPETKTIEAPEGFDTSRSDCIIDVLGLQRGEIDEAQALIATNTTDKNRLLYTGCGFTLFPPGLDLNDD